MIDYYINFNKKITNKKLSNNIYIIILNPFLIFDEQTMKEYKTFLK